jgi:methylmalonyl-CoA mutase, N-terminal domain
MEAGARAYWDAIDRMGGMVKAIEHGYPQKEIADAAYRFQQAVERREQVIVGVNDFVQEGEAPIETLYIDASAERLQLERLTALKASRNANAVGRALEGLRQTARSAESTMPAILECVRAYATLGEMCDVLREVWGEYEERPVI